MELPILRACLLLNLFTITDALVVPQEAYHVQAPISDAVPFAFRDAKIDDIDEVNIVNYEAFRRGEAWKYIYQFADEVEPGYTLACQRAAFVKLILHDSERYRLRVLAVPDPSSERGERVVSISAWDYTMTGILDQPSLASPSSMVPEGPLILGDGDGDLSFGTPFDCSAHLDVNMTRALHYMDHMNSAVRRSIVEPFSRYLYLGLLATHPDWDGNGFAAQHLHWGKAEVARLNREADEPMPITLVATPAGYPLYMSEGFSGLENITIERLDGKGTLWWEAMKYDDDAE